MTQKISVSALKDIKILYKGDIYELACLLLKIYDAKDKINKNVISRFTIKGLVNYYYSITRIDYEKIIKIFEQHTIPLGTLVESDKMPENKIVRVDFKSATNVKEHSEGADEKWNKILDNVKEKILHTVWCGNCRISTTIKNFRRDLRGGALVLEGKCSVCNGTVLKVLEEEE